MNFNPEHVLIPFEVSPLPTGPWLVFAPHADDETFGMGGALLRARAEGVATHVVVVTDGALGGDDPNLVAVRRQEIERVAQMLGLASLTCWSEPDRGVGINPETLAKAAREIRQRQPASVFLPGPLEIHPDHRATGLLVWQALQSLRQQHSDSHEIEVISYEISVQNPVNFFLDVTDQRAQKEAVMAVYASQNQQNNYPELVLALDKGRTFSLPAGIEFAEGFYRFSAEELAQELPQVLHSMIDRYLAQP